VSGDELVGGTVSRTYTYGMQRIAQDQVINNAWTPSFYGYDGGGNVRQLTNVTGAITDTYDYDAFGNKINSTGTTPNHFMYRGEEYDSDLGLYYLRARYYNPTTGRFMSRDPEEGKFRVPATLHKYLYASGDPANRIDPSGKADFVEVNLDNAEISFKNHGLIHLFKVGAADSQVAVEAYVKALVSEFIAEMQAAGVQFYTGNLFDLMFNSPILGNVPWAARVFIVSAAEIEVTTYFPQNRP